MKGFFIPNSEKLFLTLTISGMLFLTLTGFNSDFLLCNSPTGFCSLNYLEFNQSYNINSYLIIILIFSIMPYLLACITYAWFE